MARVTVEDCLELVPNRFALVVLAAGRARQICKGSTPMVDRDNKPAVTALREIAENKVMFNENVADVIEQFLIETRTRGVGGEAGTGDTE